MDRNLKFNFVHINAFILLSKRSNLANKTADLLSGPDKMKQLALIFYSLFVISCNHYAPAHSDNMGKPGKRGHAIALIDNGFLKYADSSKIDNLKLRLINTFDIYEDGNFRIAHVDAEELAEFSFDFFLPGLNRILAKRGMNLSVRKLNDNENSFDVLINGDTIQLYNKSDIDNNSFRDTASRTFFRKLNGILKEKDSDEQFYLLYSGNSLHALLLTYKQFSVISDYYKHNDKEQPYKP